MDRTVLFGVTTNYLTNLLTVQTCINPLTKLEEGSGSWNDTRLKFSFVVTNIIPVNENIFFKLWIEVNPHSSGIFLVHSLVAILCKTKADESSLPSLPCCIHPAICQSGAFHKHSITHIKHFPLAPLPNTSPPRTHIHRVTPYSVFQENVFFPLYFLHCSLKRSYKILWLQPLWLKKNCRLCAGDYS